MKTIEFVLFIGAMFFYIRHLLVNKFVPHPIAFAIWLISDIINFVTYTDFSKFWVGPAIMPLGALIVVIIGIIKRKQVKRTSFTILDWICIGICVISIPIWIVTKNAIWSNLIIQIIIALGFVPIIGNLVHKKPEPLLPWFLFFVGWVVTCIDTLIGYVSILEFIYPVINGLIGCSIIFFWSLVLDYRKK